MLMQQINKFTGKIVQKFNNSKQLYQRNYNLMQLNQVNIPANYKLKIIQMMQKTKINKLSRHNFILTAVKDQLQGHFNDIQKHLDSYRYLSGYAEKYNNDIK